MGSTWLLAGSRGACLNLGRPSSPPHGQTDTCENITFPQLTASRNNFPVSKLHQGSIAVFAFYKIQTLNILLTALICHASYHSACAYYLNYSPGEFPWCDSSDTFLFLKHYPLTFWQPVPGKLCHVRRICFKAHHLFDVRRSAVKRGAVSLM